MCYDKMTLLPTYSTSSLPSSFFTTSTGEVASGGRVTDIVKITLLVKNHDDERLKYLVKKRRELFGKNLPASTLIPVPVLALEALEFEVDAIAITASHTME